MSTLELARRHWRFFAPTWLLFPDAMMLIAVAHDITGDPRAATYGFPFIVAPVMLESGVSAFYLQHRERLPWDIFYGTWLAPMMAVWGSLILLRAAILISLGRPS